MKAICSRPVQLYDEGLAGIYDVGAVLEGEKASLALERYPQFFVPEQQEAAAGAKGRKK